MKKIRAWIRAFFGFSKRETNGFIILLPLTILIIFSEPIFRRIRTSETPDNYKHLDSLLATLTLSDSAVTAPSVTVVRNFSRPEIASVQFHFFDPNTIEKAKLQQLGLSESLTERIVRYRNKGGKFRTIHDLKKIYGMDSVWLQHASRWITIREELKPSKPDWPSPEKKQSPIRLTDINTADSLRLIKIYGIGPALSKRILKFRDRLGGFISIDQLNEVYGLDTAAIRLLKREFFVAVDFVPVRISINKISTEDTKHPYLKWKEVQAIVAYRNMHGSFTSLDQLLEIKIVEQQWLDRVRPYLEL